MGRRKIEIEPIRDDRNRLVTFIKRKQGLFKKAHELAVLCEVDVAVIILGSNDTFYEFSSVDTNQLLDAYQNKPELHHDCCDPSAFGDFKKNKTTILHHSRSTARPTNTTTKDISMSQIEDTTGDEDEDESNTKDDDTNNYTYHNKEPDNRYNSSISDISKTRDNSQFISNNNRGFPKRPFVQTMDSFDNNSSDNSSSDTNNTKRMRFDNQNSSGRFSVNQNSTTALHDSNQNPTQLEQQSLQQQGLPQPPQLQQQSLEQQQQQQPQEFQPGNSTGLSNNLQQHVQKQFQNLFMMTKGARQMPKPIGLSQSFSSMNGGQPSDEDSLTPVMNPNSSGSSDQNNGSENISNEMMSENKENSTIQEDLSAESNERNDTPSEGGPPKPNLTVDIPSNQFVNSATIHDDTSSVSTNGQRQYQIQLNGINSNDNLLKNLSPISSNPLSAFDRSNQSKLIWKTPSGLTPGLPAVLSFSPTTTQFQGTTPINTMLPTRNSIASENQLESLNNPNFLQSQSSSLGDASAMKKPSLQPLHTITGNGNDVPAMGPPTGSMPSKYIQDLMVSSPNNPSMPMFPDWSLGPTNRGAQQPQENTYDPSHGNTGLTPFLQTGQTPTTRFFSFNSDMSEERSTK